MKDREMADFCKQLAKVVKAGMTFEEGINLLADEGNNNPITNIREKMNQGKTFMEGLEEEQLFKEELLEMVKIGVETGHLEVVFHELSLYFEREDWLKAMLKSALYYPAILGSMLIMVMSILLIKVMPIFEEVFMGMGIIATGLTKWIFEVSKVVGIGILGILIFSLLSIGILYGVASYKPTKHLWINFYNKSKIAELTSYIRFTGMVGVMLRSGIEIHRAFELGCHLLPESKVRSKVEQCRKQLVTTFDLDEALKESELFPAFMRRNIMLGLMTGTLDEAFEEVSKDFEEQLDKTLNRGLSVLEPIVAGIISLIVGGILLSVMMPLMSVMNGFMV